MTFSKNILKSVIIISLALVCMKGIFASTPWLHVEGNQIKDPDGNTVILRGISMIDIGAEESWYGGAFNNIDRITNQNDSQGNSPGWYTKIIRIPVVPYDSGFQSPVPFRAGSDDFYNNLLRPVIDYCKQKDVYAIIDWHYIDDVNNHVQTTTEFWQYIAPKFANDSNVLFELFNEPINDGTDDAADWNVVKGYMQDWYNIVRSAAPDNLILVGTPAWCQILAPTVNNPVIGQNIVYVVHIYPGHWKYDWYRDQLSQAAIAHPFLLTEWGFSQSNEAPDSIAYGSISDYGQPLMDFIESYCIGNTAWCANYEWGPPMFNNNWTLRCGEGEMGCFVKDQLYKMRNIYTPGTGTPEPGFTPIPVPTPTPEPTIIPGIGICLGVPYWESDVIYDVPGYQVQYNNNLYQNRWYTQNQVPDQNTGDAGVWELLGPCDQSETPTPTPGSGNTLGDVNGDGSVAIIDALLIAQYYVGLNPSPFNINSADTNCDGNVNIIDALLVAQYYVGLINTFC